MITRCRLIGRTTIVIALTTFVVAASARAMAQEAHAGPWWSILPFPTGPAQEALFQNIHLTPASSFDPNLPPIPIEAWLFGTLAPRVEVLHPRLVEWRLDFCGAYARSANPQIVTATGPELCARGAVQVSDDKNVQLVIVVAHATRETLAWQPVPPSLKEVYIERVQDRFTRLDSLDVPELSRLDELLRTPSEQWPRVDFESQITWDPPMPSPGETARISISIRNTGQRAADRAWIKILISPCCDTRFEVRRDWFPYLAAGQSARVDFEVPLPEGRALAIVDVRLGPSDKRVHENLQDVDKRPTSVAIGYPARPPR